MEIKDATTAALEFDGKKENIEMDAIAGQEIKDFLSKYPYREKPELLSTITPEDLYDKAASDCFFNWIEKKTGHAGTIDTHEGVVFSGAVKRFDFFKVILRILVSDKKSVSAKIDQNWGIIPGFGGDKLIAKKILFLYYSDQIVPIFKTEDLERFSDDLKIQYKDNSMERFKKDYSSLSVGEKFELLSANLFDFRKSNLGKMTNTQFAHFLYQMPLLTKSDQSIPGASVKDTGTAAVSQTHLDQAKQFYEAKLKEAEKTIVELRNEIKFRDLRSKETEERLRFKEEEFNRHEVDLQHREKVMKEELRQLEIKKQQLGSTKEVELKRALEELRAQIREKEEKLRSMEKYLAQKEEDIKFRESALMGSEISQSEESIVSDVKQEKVKSGTPRLDDLLMGGIPVGSQVVIYGPSFIGKEIAMNAFAAEGLKKGIPVMWITTDKTIDEIREEMSHLINSYREYEKLGLVYYIDAYSRIIGDNSVAENANYLDDSADIENIGTMAEDRLTSMGDLIQKKGVRLIFRSVSSLSATHDIKSIFTLLRPFVAKRKKDRCVTMYSVEKGIMDEQDLQVISTIMDGIIEFSTDGKSNFISVQGICETQTRDKIKYTASKGALTIGSFTLGHIK